MRLEPCWRDPDNARGYRPRFPFGPRQPNRAREAGEAEPASVFMIPASNAKLSPLTGPITKAVLCPAAGRPLGGWNLLARGMVSVKMRHATGRGYDRGNSCPRYCGKYSCRIADAAVSDGGGQDGSHATIQEDSPTVLQWKVSDCRYTHLYKSSETFIRSRTLHKSIFYYSKRFDRVI